MAPMAHLRRVSRPWGHPARLPRSCKPELVSPSKRSDSQRRRMPITGAKCLQLFACAALDSPYTLHERRLSMIEALQSLGRRVPDRVFAIIACNSQ